MANINTSALSNYVEEHNIPLINQIVIGGSIIQDLTVQPGIKTKARIHYLSTDPTFQDGSACGFNAAGTAALTEREIVTGLVKVNMEFCQKELLGKYAEYLVRISAGAEDLGFEKELVDSIIANIQKKLEVKIFQGRKDGGDQFDGLIKVATDAGVSEDTLTKSDGAYANIKQIYMSLPESALEKGATIYVSPATYREFTQELVAKNLFHYAGPIDAAPTEIMFPGTDVKVKKAAGLAGTDYILAGHPKDWFYGCDLSDANEELKIWYSNDDDVVRMKALWNSGLQVAFPDEVKIGKRQ